METAYVVYRTNGTIDHGAVSWPGNPAYDQLRALIDPLVGGRLEHVNVLDPAKTDAPEVTWADYRDMFVDEDGHAKGKPRNEAATVIYRANWLRAHPGDKPEELDWIVGDAVVFDRHVWR